MKASLLWKWSGGALSVLILAGVVSAADDALVTAVFAKVHNGYQRAKNEDGSFARQTYVVGKGTYDAGVNRNASIDGVPFAGVVRALAPFLAKRNFVPAPDRESADLMLVLHWGTTKPFDDGLYNTFLNGAAQAISGAQNASGLPNTPALGNTNRIETSEASALRAAAEQEKVSWLMTLEMGNRMREQSNEHNANLLGYVDEINRRNNNTRHAGAGTAFDELLEDIETERYYVVIGAYDFQAVLKGQPKLVWSTRVSIRARGNRFDTWLPTMFANASHYFGEGSGRLVRRYQRASQVELGELKTLGIVENPAKKPTTQ